MKTLVLNQAQTTQLNKEGVVLVKRPTAQFKVVMVDGAISATMTSTLKVIDEWRNMDDKTIRLTRKEHDDLTKNGYCVAQRNGKLHTINLDAFGAPQVIVDNNEPIMVLTSEEVE